jgi:hypothetical protein
MRHQSETRRAGDATGPDNVLVCDWNNSENRPATPFENGSAAGGWAERASGRWKRSNLPKADARPRASSAHGAFLVLLRDFVNEALAGVIANAAAAQAPFAGGDESTSMVAFESEARS